MKDKNFYVGFTKEQKNRFRQLGRGKVKSTKNRRPLILLHYEYFINKLDAVAREVFFKSGFGRNQLRKALKRKLEKLLLIYIKITPCGSDFNIALCRRSLITAKN